MSLVTFNVRSQPVAPHRSVKTEDCPTAKQLAALELVERIDEDLTRGIRHYRTKQGKLLQTLDQVINAILANNLASCENI